MDKPQILSINTLPDSTLEILREYMDCHLKGDLEGVQRALAALEQPPQEKARLKRPEQIQTTITNPLAFGEQVTDNNIKQ